MLAKPKINRDYSKQTTKAFLCLRINFKQLFQYSFFELPQKTPLVSVKTFLQYMGACVSF